MKKLSLLTLTLCTALTTSQSYGVTKDITTHPLMDDRNIETLKTVAEQFSSSIDAKFHGKKHVILALGHSSAYLLEMIKLLDEKSSRKDREYIHVAFSGTTDTDTEVDNEDSKIKYKDYLVRIGMDKILNDPNKIIIVIDWVCTGIGLSKFLRIFNSLFNRKLEYLYVGKSNNFFLSKDNCVYGNIELEENVSFFGALGKTDEFGFNDRLVPTFKPSQWLTEDPTTFQISENAKIILAKLKNYVFECPIIKFVRNDNVKAFAKGLSIGFSVVLSTYYLLKYVARTVVRNRA